MKLVWSKPAIADLMKVEAWLTENVDPLTAEEQIDRIRQKARRLVHFPSRGPLLCKLQHYAQVEKTPFRLIYRIAPDEIQILRIRHNREDWRL